MVCHLDPVPVSNERYLAVLQTLREIVATTAEGLKIHDFRVIKEGEILQFDVVVPQKCHFSDEKLEEIIREQVKQKIGKYQVEITFDHNYLL